MATGFTGTTYHALDGKNRIVLPAGLRYSLGASFTMSKGLDGCLWAMTSQDWAAKSERFQSLSIYDPDGRRVREHFLGSATEVRVDEQGRMTLPNPLRVAAAIETEIVVVGNGDLIEIWPQRAWEARNRAELTPEKVEEALGRLISDGKLDLDGDTAFREI